MALAGQHSRGHILVDGNIVRHQDMETGLGNKPNRFRRRGAGPGRSLGYNQCQYMEQQRTLTIRFGQQEINANTSGRCSRDHGWLRDGQQYRRMC